jgi:hypothetical protein
MKITNFQNTSLEVHLNIFFFLTFFIIFFLNIKQMVIFHHCENIVPDLVGMLIEWS